MKTCMTWTLDGQHFEACQFHDRVSLHTGRDEQREIVVMVAKSTWSTRVVGGRHWFYFNTGLTVVAPELMAAQLKRWFAAVGAIELS